MKSYRLIGPAFYVLLVLGPIFLLGLEGVGRILVSPNEVLPYLIPTGRKLTLLMNSGLLALGVAGSAACIGTGAASFLWRYRSFRGCWFFLVFAPLPPYIHALVWSYLVNSLNQWLPPGMQVGFSGPWASWWVLVMAYLPLATAFGLIGLELIPRRLLEGARLFRRDLAVLLHIQLPLAGSLIGAGAGLIFVLVLTDYSVPSLFQYSVYALDSFADYSASGDGLRGFLSALPLIGVAVGVLFLSQGGIQRAALEKTTGQTMPGKSGFPWWVKFLQGLALALLIVQIAVPLGVLLLQKGAWLTMGQIVVEANSEILWTLLISGLAALLALMLAFPLAQRLWKKGGKARMVWLAVLLPIGVPGSVVGIGVIQMWHWPIFNFLTDSLLMPVLGSAGRFTPLAVLVLLAQWRRIHPGLLESADLLQRNSLHGWVKVWLPLLAPGIWAALAVVFLLTAGELGATLMLLPPGKETLTVKIYNYMHYGASDAVAGLSLLIVLTVVVLGVAVMGVVGGVGKGGE